VSIHRVDADGANRPPAQNVRDRHLPEHLPLVDSSPQMLAILTIIGNIADIDTTVLILGESGVEKDLTESLREIARRGARQPIACVRDTGEH